MKYIRLLNEQFRNLDQQTRLGFGIAIAVILAVAILLSAVNKQTTALIMKRTARESDLIEMMQLRQQYQQASAVAHRLANRLTATKPDDSPAKLIEETGIKGKNCQIKPLKGEESGGYVEDAAEVRMDGLSANEAVNLLFKLEKGAKPVVIKKAMLKTRFDDPSKLDLTLTVALLKPAPQGQQ